MRLLGLLLALALTLPGVAAARNTHPACGGDLFCEMARRDADLATGYALIETAGNCTHSPSASLTVSAPQCHTYVPDGTYIWQPPVPITYSGGDGTYYLIVHKSVAAVVAGWTRVIGTHYLYTRGSGTLRPDIPEDAALVMMSVVSGGAVTEAIGALVPPPRGEVLVDCSRYQDATAAIQAAIDAIPVFGGGTVTLLGRCRVTHEIVIARSSLTLQGQAPSGRWRGSSDPDRSAAGAHVEVGANLPGAVFRFTTLEGVGSQGNTLRDLAIFGGGDTSEGRAYTVGTAAVYLDGADLFTLENVRIVGIKGRAVWAATSIRSVMRNLDLTISGDTGKPCLELGAGTAGTLLQGSVVESVRVEQCHLAPYIQLSANSSRVHLAHVVMETMSSNDLTWQTFLDLNGISGHQVSDVSINSPRGTPPAIIVRSDFNVLSNLSFAGPHGGIGIQLLGPSNTVAVVTWNTTAQLDFTTPYDAVEVHSDSNLLSDLRIRGPQGGVSFVQPSATQNQVRGVIHTGANAYTIKDTSNGRNHFYSITSNGGTTYPEAKVQLAGGDLLAGAYISGLPEAAQGIVALGERGRIDNVTVTDLPKGHGIYVQGNDWQIVNSRIRTVGRSCLRVANVRPGMISNNLLYECGLLSPNTFDGIELLNDTGTVMDTSAVVRGNSIQKGTATPRSSIYMTGVGGAPQFTNVVMTDNHIRDGGEAQIPAGDNNLWVANFTQAFNTTASGATLTPPTYAGSLKVTGENTTITAITLRPPGPPLCLQFDTQSTITVQDNATLRLQGNFDAHHEDTLCLLSNGTYWYELSRSEN